MSLIIDDLTVENSVTLQGSAVGTPVALTPDLANAQGSATALARADHVHNVPTAAAIGLSATTTNTQGSALTFARSDHTHAISTGAPSTQIPDQANATGTSANLARADHIHNIAADVAVSQSTSTTNTEGTSNSFARADHTHNISITNTHIARTANFTITAGADTLVTTMTNTPAAGTYLVMMSCSADVTAGGTDEAIVSIYSGGAQATGTERHMQNASGINAASISAAAQAIVTVNGAQAIEMRARQIGGNQTLFHATLTILRIV